MNTNMKINMKPIDKKQIPQFAALCVVSAGVFGYLVVHLVAPGTASAGTRPAASPHPALPVAAAGPAPAVPSAASAVSSAAGSMGAAASTDAPDAPPPSPAMHDPFAVGYADPSTTAATAPGPAQAPGLPKMLPAPGKTASVGPLAALPTGPSAPALPGSLSPFPVRPPRPTAAAVTGPRMGGVTSLPAAPAAPALPAAPAPPAWTVTGVLEGASGEVAILRSGDARRIVRAGDFVDGTYRVAGVTRTSVFLRHGAAVYQIPLGGAKAGPAPAPLPAMPAAAPPPSPRSAAVLDSTLVPAYRAAPVHAPLAQLKDQEPAGLAAETPTARPASPAALPAQVAGAVSVGPRLLDGSELAPAKE